MEERTSVSRDSAASSKAIQKTIVSVPLSAKKKVNKQVYITNWYWTWQFGSLASLPCQALSNLGQLWADFLVLKFCLLLFWMALTEECTQWKLPGKLLKYLISKNIKISLLALTFDPLQTKHTFVFCSNIMSTMNSVVCDIGTCPRVCFFFYATFLIGHLNYS